MFRLQRTDAPLWQVVVLVTVKVVFVAALTPTGDSVSLGAVSVLIDDATVTPQPSQLGPVSHDRKSTLLSVSTFHFATRNTS